MSQQIQRIFDDARGNRNRFIMQMVNLDYTMEQAREHFTACLTKVSSDAFVEANGSFGPFDHIMTERGFSSEVNMKLYGACLHAAGVKPVDRGDV